MEPSARTHRPNPITILILAILATFSIYSFGRYVRGLIFGFPDPLGLHSQPSPTPSPWTQPSAAPSIQPPHVVSPPRGEHWKAFAARFGDTLKAERGANGKIAAIRGAPGNGEKAAGDFRPSDEAEVIARAREVLDALREEIGVETDLPLGQPAARTGPVSAQVIFSETKEGVPLAPGGNVSIDLGPQGEVLNVTSNYVSPLPVVNQRSVAVEQAKTKAEASVPEPGSSLTTLGGNAIVWVTRTGPGGAAVGHQAFEFNVAGRQVIIDAGNGEVLFKRDRRQF